MPDFKYMIGEKVALTNMEDFPQFNGVIVEISGLKEAANFEGDSYVSAYYFKSDNIGLRNKLDWIYETKLKPLEPVVFASIQRFVSVIIRETIVLCKVVSVEVDDFPDHVSEVEDEARSEAYKVRPDFKDWEIQESLEVQFEILEEE